MPETTAPAAAPAAATPTSAPAPAPASNDTAAPVPAATPGNDTTPTPDAAAKPAEAAAVERGAKARATLERLRTLNAARDEARRADVQRAAEYEQQARQAALRAQQVEQENAKLLQRAERWEKADPYELLAERGETPETLLERAKAEKDPVLKAQKIAEANAAELKALKDHLAAKDREAEETLTRQRAATIQKANEDNFVAAAGNAAKFPTIAKLAASRPFTVLAEAKALIADVKATAEREGRPVPMLTDEHILEWLEVQWSKTPFAAALNPASASASQAPKATASSPLSSTAPNAGASPTLTNSTTQERTTLDIDPATLPKSEQTKYWREFYASKKSKPREA
jgi:hypothetical protein